MSLEMQVFRLPDLGEGLTEAELVNWLVTVGDEIKVDQPIAEVETAKSTVEVPSPYAGTVATLHGQAGETLDVGKPLISIAPAGAAPAEPKAPAATQDAVSTAVVADAEASAAAETYRTEEKAGSGNVLIGYGTPGGTTAGRTRPKKNSTKALPAGDYGTSYEATSMKKLRPVISPLVRKMARENNVALDGLEGSGANGTILRQDVKAAIAGKSSGSQPSTSESQQPIPLDGPNLSDARTGLIITQRTPVRGVRKAIATAMTRSRSEIPEATVWVDVDATALLSLRSEQKENTPNDTPGLLAFIARFVTAGLKKYPALNTRFETREDGTQEIVEFTGINLGFAAQTDRGLVVPSVRNAHELTARELDAEIRRLTALARAGKATPSDLTSGTFTLNNYGVFGVDGSAAIINHPEVAMLGLGRIIDKPWVVDDKLVIRKVTQLTLAFDHRVCDGETAAGFLRFVADAIENPHNVIPSL